MKIKYVTFTGADDNTKQEELLNLSERFPFVEWGILFSQKKSGVSPRYPGWDWVLDLANILSFDNKARFSSHLCGKWVDDAMNGEFTFGSTLLFKRIQLNMAQGRLSKSLSPESKIWKAVAKIGKDVIFGGPYQKQKYDFKPDLEMFAINGVFPLFDTSGGRGQLTKEWPNPFDLFCGYAGGLSPDNLEDELKRIEDVVGDSTIWIDMESGVRSDGEFDLNKCEKVCDLVGGYVEL